MQRSCNLFASAQGSDLCTAGRFFAVWSIRKLLFWLVIVIVTLHNKLCSHIEVIIDILPNQIHTLLSFSFFLYLSNLPVLN